MTKRQYCRFCCNKILIDVDTQKDLLLADGAASVYNHRRVLANIRRVMAAARREHIPTISTVRIVEADSRQPGFCVAGTQGCRKLSYTVRDNYAYFDSSDSTDLPGDLLKKYDQVVFAKRGPDPFEEPRLDRMLTELYTDEIFIIGATLEGAVKDTVEGLTTRGHNVTVLIDAVGIRDRAAAEKNIRKISAHSARLARTTEILGTSRLQTVHACSCPRCRAAIEQKQETQKCIRDYTQHSIAV